MRVLFLTNNPLSLQLADWIAQDEGMHVTVWAEKVDASVVKTHAPDWIISYNYKYIIRDDVLQLLPRRVINLHISYLPYNKGSDPNLWSFIEDTPKGVTIHEVDAGLDTGPIIAQQLISFDENAETLASTYTKLQTNLQALFRNAWPYIQKDLLPRYSQAMDQGTVHKKKDLEPYRGILTQHGFEITPAFFVNLVKQQLP